MAQPLSNLPPNFSSCGPHSCGPAEEMKFRLNFKEGKRRLRVVLPTSLAEWKQRLRLCGLYGLAQAGRWEGPSSWPLGLLANPPLPRVPWLYSISNSSPLKPPLTAQPTLRGETWRPAMARTPCSSRIIQPSKRASITRPRWREDETESSVSHD